VTYENSDPKIDSKWRETLKRDPELNENNLLEKTMQFASYIEQQFKDFGMPILDTDVIIEDNRLLAVHEDQIRSSADVQIVEFVSTDDLEAKYGQKRVAQQAAKSVKPFFPQPIFIQDEGQRVHQGTFDIQTTIQVNDPAFLQRLNNHLESRPFLGNDYLIVSPIDAAIFSAFRETHTEPDLATHPNVWVWYSHLSKYDLAFIKLRLSEFDA
jgi:hypothetical protein